jgi:hypothetical protein
MNLTYKQISAMLLIVFSFTISAALAQDSGEQKSVKIFAQGATFLIRAKRRSKKYAK